MFIYDSRVKALARALTLALFCMTIVLTARAQNNLPGLSGPVTRIALNIGQTQANVNAIVPATVLAYDDAGNSSDVTGVVDWSSESSDIVAISGDGSLLCVGGVGVTTITVKFEELSASVPFRVTNAIDTAVPFRIDSMTNKPANPDTGRQKAFVPGERRQMSVFCDDGAGAEVTNLCTFSTDNSAVATVEASVSSTTQHPGKVTANNVGFCTLTASAGDLQGTTVLKIAKFTVTDLGALHSDDTVDSGFSGPINDNGDVAALGWESLANAPEWLAYGDTSIYSVPYLFSASNSHQRLGLPTISWGSFYGNDVHLNGINNAGFVVGSAIVNAGPSPYNPERSLWIGHAILWPAAGPIDLGTLAGLTGISGATAINSNNDVVGYSYTQDWPSGGGAQHAVRWPGGGGIQDLGTLGGASSCATAINDNGDIVGYSYNIAGQLHAFLYSGGFMRDLGTLGGATSQPSRITADGVVFGTSQTANGETHNFQWTPAGGMRDTGSAVFQVGGPGLTDFGAAVAFINGTPLYAPDLFAILTQDEAVNLALASELPSDWTPQPIGALTINSLGQIAMTVRLPNWNDGYHIVLLTPPDDSL